MQADILHRNATSSSWPRVFFTIYRASRQDAGVRLTDAPEIRFVSILSSDPPLQTLQPLNQTERWPEGGLWGKKSTRSCLVYCNNLTSPCHICPVDLPPPPPPPQNLVPSFRLPVAGGPPAAEGLLPGEFKALHCQRPILGDWICFERSDTEKMKELVGVPGTLSTSRGSINVMMSHDISSC